MPRLKRNSPQTWYSKESKMSVYLAMSKKPNHKGGSEIFLPSPHYIAVNGRTALVILAAANLSSHQRHRSVSSHLEVSAPAKQMKPGRRKASYMAHNRAVSSALAAGAAPRCLP